MPRPFRVKLACVLRYIIGTLILLSGSAVVLAKILASF